MISNSRGLKSVDLWIAWQTNGLEYPLFQVDLRLRYDAIRNRWRQHLISIACISVALTTFSSTDSKHLDASFLTLIYL